MAMVRLLPRTGCIGTCTCCEPTARHLRKLSIAGGKGAACDTTFFKRREFCFTLEGDIFTRYRSYHVRAPRLPLKPQPEHGVAAATMTGTAVCRTARSCKQH